MSGGTSLEQRRTVLEQACEALEGLSEELWSAGGADLGSLLGLVDRVGELADAGRVAVVSEAVERGEAGGGTPGAQRWAREHAASLRAGGSACVVRVVEHLRLPRYAALRAAVLDAQVPVANAACVVEEYERVGHRLHPWAQGPAMDLLVALAQGGGRREIRGVRRRIVARYGYDGAEGPRIKVQVKRQTSSKVSVDGLRSFMAVLSHNDVGIFVASAGFTSEAVREARMQDNRRITLIDLEQLFDMWVEHYPAMPEESSQRLPLRPVYFLDPGD